MLSNETFYWLLDFSRWQAVNPRNPFRCPCMQAADPAACMRRLVVEMRPRLRSRPRAARRRRSRTTRGRSAEPSGSSDGPSSRTHLKLAEGVSMTRPPNDGACVKGLR